MLSLSKPVFFIMLGSFVLILVLILIFCIICHRKRIFSFLKIGRRAKKVPPDQKLEMNDLGPKSVNKPSKASKSPPCEDSNRTPSPTPSTFSDTQHNRTKPNLNKKSSSKSATYSGKERLSKNLQKRDQRCLNSNVKLQNNQKVRRPRRNFSGASRKSNFTESIKEGEVYEGKGLQATNAYLNLPELSGIKEVFWGYGRTRSNSMTRRSRITPSYPPLHVQKFKPIRPNLHPRR